MSRPICSIAMDFAPNRIDKQSINTMKASGDRRWRACSGRRSISESFYGSAGRWELVFIIAHRAGDGGSPAPPWPDVEGAADEPCAIVHRLKSNAPLQRLLRVPWELSRRRNFIRR